MTHGLSTDIPYYIVNTELKILLKQNLTIFPARAAKLHTDIPKCSKLFSGVMRHKRTPTSKFIFISSLCYGLLIHPFVALIHNIVLKLHVTIQEIVSSSCNYSSSICPKETCLIAYVGWFVDSYKHSLAHTAGLV